MKHLRKIVSLLFLAALISACESGADSETTAKKTTPEQAAEKKPAAKQNQVWTPSWREGPPMITPRSGAALTEVDGIIHIIGGVDGTEFLRSSEYTKVSEDGSLTEWKLGPALNIERSFFSVVRYKNYAYAVGGGRGAYGKILLDSIERAEIQPDGTLGSWSVETFRLNTKRRCSKLAIIGNHIYAFGGFGGTLLDTVERTEIQPDGTLGEWEVLLDTMQLARYIHGVKNVRDRVYVIGGHDKEKGVGITDVEWSHEDSEGWLEPWQTSNPLQTGRYGLATVQHGSYLYALGGLDGAAYLSSIEKVRINEDGSLAAWSFTTPLPSPREGLNAVSVNGNIYAIGGTNLDGYKGSVEYATFNEQGDIGYWTTPAEAEAKKAELSRRKAQERILPNEGVITQHIKASRYSYLLAKRDDGLSAWLAGPVTNLPVGARIQFPNGVVMRGFLSKELKRRFQVIMFVGEVRKVKPAK